MVLLFLLCFYPTGSFLFNFFFIVEHLANIANQDIKIKNAAILNVTKWEEEEIDENQKNDYIDIESLISTKNNHYPNIGEQEILR